MTVSVLELNININNGIPLRMLPVLISDLQDHQRCEGCGCDRHQAHDAGIQFLHRGQYQLGRKFSVKFIVSGSFGRRSADKQARSRG